MDRTYQGKSFILFLVFLSFVYVCQAAGISGIIKSKKTGEPLPYVAVMLSGQNDGVHSNVKGFYNILISNVGENTLKFSLMSYKTKTITVNLDDLMESRIINVELEKEAMDIEGSSITEPRARRTFKANTQEIRPGNVLSSADQLLKVSQFGEGDIIRSIQTLPGVSSVSDFSNGLYIWGGTYDQNLILLDDIDVYNPTHFGGVFSTFNTDAINTVELMKGGYPSLYGGRLSSVLKIDNREGNRKFHQGKAHWGLISAAATIEGPINRSAANSSYMASFRRSYFDLITKAIGDLPQYYFYDGHARVNWDLSPTNKFSLSLYNGRDRLVMDLFSDLELSWGNTTFTFMNNRILKDGLLGSFIIAGSGFDSKLRAQQDDIDLYDWDNNIRDISFKSRFSKRLSGNSRFEWGLEAKYNRIKFQVKSDLQYDPSSLYNIKGEGLTVSGYVHSFWQPSLFWNIEPGIRLNYYKLMKASPSSAPAQESLNISPRLAFRRIIDHSSNIYFATGRYYQYLVMISSGVNSPMDVWFPIDGSVEPSFCDHFILGYKKEFGSHFAMDADAYYKDFNNLVEQDQDSYFTWDNDEAKLSDVLLNGTGYAWGADILLRTNWQGISGFAGYSLGITRRKMDEANTDPETGLAKYYYTRFDRTHQFNMMENFYLSDLFDLGSLNGEPSIGLNVTYKTGQPVAKPELAYFDGSHYEILYSYYDRVRLPDYFRIDLSLRWKFNNNWGTVEPYLEAVNITNHENIDTRSYMVEIDENDKLNISTEDFEMLPFIPMIGIAIEW